MGDDGSLDDTIESNVKDVSSTETVARGREFGNSTLPQACDDFVQRWPGLLLTVIWEPGSKINLETKEMSSKTRKISLTTRLTEPFNSLMGSPFR